jgi:hypothetical protein
MRRQVTMPLYAVLVLVVAATFGPILSIYASTQIAKANQAKALAAAQATENRTREESRLRTCDLFGRLLDVYSETPPTTPAGRNVQRAYRSFYNAPENHCQPPR